MSNSRFVVAHIRLTTAKPFDEVTADFERQPGRLDGDADTIVGRGRDRRDYVARRSE